MAEGAAGLSPSQQEEAFQMISSQIPKHRDHVLLPSPSPAVQDFTPPLSLKDVSITFGQGSLSMYAGSGKQYSQVNFTEMPDWDVHGVTSSWFRRVWGDTLPERMPWHIYDLLTPHEPIRRDMMLMRYAFQDGAFDAVDAPWKPRLFFSFFRHWDLLIHFHHEGEDELLPAILQLLVEHGYANAEEISKHEEFIRTIRSEHLEIISSIAAMRALHLEFDKAAEHQDSARTKELCQDLSKMVLDFTSLFWQHLSREEEWWFAAMTNLPLERVEKLMKEHFKSAKPPVHVLASMLPWILDALEKWCPPEAIKALPAGQLPVPVRLVADKVFFPAYVREHKGALVALCTGEEPPAKGHVKCCCTIQ